MKTPAAIFSFAFIFLLWSCKDQNLENAATSVSNKNFQLKQTLEHIAGKWKYKLDTLESPGVYRMDVAIKVNKNKWHYQFVYIWESKERYLGKPAIYMNSRCGELNDTLNYYNLLKEAGSGNLSSLTITTDKRADGTPCEMVICQTGLPVEFISEDLLSNTIYEVANNADIIEEKYFGGEGDN